MLSVLARNTPNSSILYSTVDTYFEHGTLKLKGKNLQSHVKEDIVLEKKTFHFNQVRYST